MDLKELLEQSGVISIDTESNSSNQFIGKCPDCGKKKFYINAEEDTDKYGLSFCHVCSASYNLTELFRRLQPESDEQLMFRAIHEYSIKALLKNKAALNHLLKDRDFTEEDIKNYGLGYFGKTFVNDIVSNGIATKDELKESGFISESQSLPVFWNHISFPYISGGEYLTFKGRNLDIDTKRKYISLSGRDVPLYQAQDLHKAGRVFLTEGEAKCIYMKSNGYNATSVSGAGNYKKFIPALKACEDLWIVLDSDRPTSKYPLGVGQAAAIELAKKLNHCHVVTLPLGDKDKVGIDDYLMTHGVDEFEKLLRTADYYEDGVKQKTRQLVTIVEEWREQARAHEYNVNLNIGIDRLNAWLNGLEDGTLNYVIGSPHNGKSVLTRAILTNLYKNDESVLLDYYSNDDSLKATLGKIVAAEGKFDSSDAKQPLLAFANEPKMLKRWEAAVKRVKGMGDRMTMLDRSYRVALEDIYKQFAHWRKSNPDGKRVLIIDGFRQQLCRAAKGSNDKMQQIEIKSQILKDIAQECNVPVICTMEPPKLYGKRPRSFDISFGSAGEFDADVIITTYIEAQSKGLPNTELKYLLQYDDAPDVEAPYIEVGVVKNKPNDILDLDVLIIDPRTSGLEELDDDAYSRAKRAIYQSQSESAKKDK